MRLPRSVAGVVRCGQSQNQDTTDDGDSMPHSQLDIAHQFHIFLFGVRAAYHSMCPNSLHKVGIDSGDHIKSTLGRHDQVQRGDRTELLITTIPHGASLRRGGSMVIG